MNYLTSPGALGAMLRTRRKDLGMTLDACALSAGVSRQTLVAVESGKGNPRLDTLRAVADVLKLQLAMSVECSSDQRKAPVHGTGA